MLTKGTTVSCIHRSLHHVKATAAALLVTGVAKAQPLNVAGKISD
jgi:hypothetical protein